MTRHTTGANDIGTVTADKVSLPQSEPRIRVVLEKLTTGYGSSPSGSGSPPETVGRLGSSPLSLVSASLWPTGLGGCE